jgi:hypothetical protein
VGLGRVELPTSPLSGARSSQLSYRPLISRHRRAPHREHIADPVFSDRIHSRCRQDPGRATLSTCRQALLLFRSGFCQRPICLRKRRGLSKPNSSASGEMTPSSSPSKVADERPGLGCYRRIDLRMVKVCEQTQQHPLERSRHRSDRS